MLGSNIVTSLESFAGLASDGATVAVVGGGTIGGALARTLLEDGATIRFLDDSEAAVARADARDIDAHLGDPTDRADLARLDPESVDVAVVADASDRRTTLSAQLLRTAFDCPVVALVSDPDNLDVIEAMDVRVVSTSALLAGGLDGLFDDAAVAREGE